MMMAEPVQLHLTVSGTVGWTAACASSNIKLLKVLAPRWIEANNLRIIKII